MNVLKDMFLHLFKSLPTQYPSEVNFQDEQFTVTAVSNNKRLTGIFNSYPFEAWVEERGVFSPVGKLVIPGVMLDVEVVFNERLEQAATAFSLELIRKFRFVDFWKEGGQKRASGYDALASQNNPDIMLDPLVNDVRCFLCDTVHRNLESLNEDLTLGAVRGIGPVQIEYQIRAEHNAMEIQFGIGTKTFKVTLHEPSAKNLVHIVKANPECHLNEEDDLDNCITEWVRAMGKKELLRPIPSPARLFELGRSMGRYYQQ